MRKQKKTRGEDNFYLSNHFLIVGKKEDEMEWHAIDTKEEYEYENFEKLEPEVEGFLLADMKDEGLEVVTTTKEWREMEDLEEEEIQVVAVEEKVKLASCEFIEDSSFHVNGMCRHLKMTLACKLHFYHFRPSIIMTFNYVFGPHLTID